MHCIPLGDQARYYHRKIEGADASDGAIALDFTEQSQIAKPGLHWYFEQ